MIMIGYIDTKMAFNKRIVKLNAIILFCLTADVIAGQQDRPCSPRSSGESVVCVCNSTYCDDVIRVEPVPGTYVSYTSSLAGLRFKKDKGSLVEANDTSKSSNSFLGISEIEPTLELDCSKKYQKIEGFGGAVTDSAAINWDKLKLDSLKESLINSFFGKNGLEYNMIRSPIGGSDFSPREYSYQDYPENDAKLCNFTLAPEDIKYKIPMIKEAIAAATDEVHIVSSVWSPPPWMKNTHKYSGFSLLLEEYLQTYADYYLKYIEAYAAENISIWGITTGNEPLTSVMGTINSLGWTTDLMMVDGHPDAEKYIDGIAVHWYNDKFTPATILKHTAETFPNKFLIGTEACSGANPTDIKKVDLGSWSRAVDYAKDIIDLQNYFVGWIDWNLCLDSQGGPSWTKNYVDASIIVFPEDGEFVKQPMYYAMGHFSKFLPRNSVRIDATDQALFGVDYVAFETPSNTYVLALYNASLDQVVTIKIGCQEASVHLPTQSIVTVELNAASN